MYIGNGFYILLYDSVINVAFTAESALFVCKGDGVALNINNLNELILSVKSLILIILVVAEH